MQGDEFDVVDENVRRQMRCQDRLFSVAVITLLIAIAVPIAVFILYRERNLAKDSNQFARLAVESVRDKGKEKPVAALANGSGGVERQVVNVALPVTNVIEKRVDVIVERKVTNYVDEVVTVTNYVDVVVKVTNFVDEVVDVVVQRTNRIERQVDLPVPSETNDGVIHEPNEAKRLVEQTLAELDGELNVGEGEPKTQDALPVTNVVERPVEVVVERLVTNVVQRSVPVDIYVDVPMTNVIERLVEIVVTNEVLRQISVVVERPETNYVERVVPVVIARPEQVVKPAVGVACVAPAAQISKTQTVVPTPQPRRPVRMTTPYRVKTGDTVGALARRYGFLIPDFMVYNPHVDINRISVGQILYLPGDVDVDR